MSELYQQAEPQRRLRAALVAPLAAALVLTGCSSSGGGGGGGSVTEVSAGPVPSDTFIKNLAPKLERQLWLDIGSDEQCLADVVVQDRSILSSSSTQLCRIPNTSDTTASASWTLFRKGTDPATSWQEKVATVPGDTNNTYFDYPTVMPSGNYIHYRTSSIDGSTAVQLNVNGQIEWVDEVSMYKNYPTTLTVAEVNGETAAANYILAYADVTDPSQPNPWQSAHVANYDMLTRQLVGINKDIATTEAGIITAGLNPVPQNTANQNSPTVNGNAAGIRELAKVLGESNFGIIQDYAGDCTGNDNVMNGCYDAHHTGDIFGHTH